MAVQEKLNFYTLSELTDSFNSGDLSPSEIVEYYLTNIQRYDSQVGAFQSTYSDLARIASKACDSSFSSGNRIGPFHGIPFVLKDIC